MPLLGAHESVGGGLHLAFDRLEQVGGEALQIFTRNQRQWNPKPLTEEEISLFTSSWEKKKGVEVASHASYLINLATGKPDLAEKSISAMTLELERCHLLNVKGVVLHPGSHGGDGVEVGLERFITAMDQAFDRANNNVNIFIETTAGQGTGLGSKFEEIAYILQNSKYPEKLGVCIDTCHIFAAGYDIRSKESYVNTMVSFEKTIGIDKVAFFHLNDSKTELGSNVDRHEHIGKGFIGLDGFFNLLNDPRFSSHSMTLETPKGKDLAEDRENLQRLRSLLKK